MVETWLRKLCAWLKEKVVYQLVENCWLSHFFRNALYCNYWRPFVFERFVARFNSLVSLLVFWESRRHLVNKTFYCTWPYTQLLDWRRHHFRARFHLAVIHFLFWNISIEVVKSTLQLNNLTRFAFISKSRVARVFCMSFNLWTFIEKSLDVLKKLWKLSKMN